MRPPILNPLFADARVLTGVGAKIEKLIAKALGTDTRPPRVLDLLFHLPFSIVDRRYRPTLIAAEPGRIATVTVNVLDHKPAPRGRRLPYRVLTTDDTAAMEIVFFTPHEDHIRKVLPPGSRRTVSGRIESFQGRLQMAHPDFIAAPDDVSAIPEVEPVYRTTEALSARTLAKAAGQALERLPDLPEWQDPAWRERQMFPAFAEALRAAHAPLSEADLSLETKARTRLAYDELLANQLALALVRDNVRRQPGRSLQGDGQHAPEGGGRPALQAHRGTDMRDRRDFGGHGIAKPHGAAASGRCRFRKDRGGHGGPAHRGRGGMSGRVHGADGDPCASASGSARTHGEGSRRKAGDPDRPGTRSRAHEHACGAGSGRNRHHCRHACDLLRGCALS